MGYDIISYSFLGIYIGIASGFCICLTARSCGEGLLQVLLLTKVQQDLFLDGTQDLELPLSGSPSLDLSIATF